MSKKDDIIIARSQLREADAELDTAERFAYARHAGPLAGYGSDGRRCDDALAAANRRLERALKLVARHTPVEA